MRHEKVVLLQWVGVLHHLNRCSAQFAGANFHVGSVQAIGCTDLAKVIWLGLAAFGNDQDAVVTCAVPVFVQTASSDVL